MIVDCSANPLDVRPAARVIVDEIVRRRSRAPDKRLALTFGEIHGAPAHALLQTLIMKILQEEKISFITGYERNTDMVAETLVMLRRTRVDKIWLDAIQAMDRINPAMTLLLLMMPDEEASQSIQVGHDDGADAGQAANNSLLSFMARESLPFILNDVPIHHEELPASFFADMARSLGLEPDLFNRRIVDRMDPFGIALRDLHMVATAHKAMVKTDAPVFIQHCGADHVLGGPHSSAVPAFGIAALFQKIGYETMPVYCDYRPEELPPHASLFAEMTGVRIIGLSAQYFNEGDRAEIDFMRAVNNASGGGLIYNEIPDAHLLDKSKIIALGKKFKAAGGEVLRSQIRRQLYALVFRS